MGVMIRWGAALMLRNGRVFAFASSTFKYRGDTECVVSAMGVHPRREFFEAFRGYDV
jgi:hypothetical protein